MPFAGVRERACANLFIRLYSLHNERHFDVVVVVYCRRRMKSVA